MAKPKATLPWAALCSVVFGAASSAAQAPPQGAEPESPLITVSRRGLGSKLQIVVYPGNGDRDAANRAIEAAFAEMTRIDGLMSEWKADSEISKVTKAAGSEEAIPVSADTFAVLSRGRQISLQSNGAFAMSWAALASLWNFRQAADEVKKFPDPVVAKKRAELVDDTALELDSKNRTARLAKRGMALGMGGLAKGYAIDRAVAVLADKGFGNVLVFAGGDIRAAGSKGGIPWLVGIQDPRAVGYFATLPVRDEAVVTSGDYENYFEHDGVRYHHMLDPKTGYPARQCRSVTIVAGDALTADAMATAVFVLGPRDGLKLIEEQDGVEALVVSADNAVSMSSGLKQRARVLRPPTQ